MKFALKTTIAAAAFAMASLASTPASAALTCTGFMDNFSPTAIDCEGFYDGNVLSNNSGDEDIQEAAVEALLGTNIDPFEFLDYPKIDGLGGATTIDLGETFFGLTVIGIHFGGGSGPNAVDNATGFFLFDFGAGGASSITTDIPASSAAVIYGGDPGGVPEPATWAMMLLGFGATGYAMRRRRKEAMPQMA